MKLEMICTGEEVLAGQIVDTNAAWLGNQLMAKGYEMHRRTTVGDRLDDLVEVFTERSKVADVILVNGGLGPTSDDLSAAAMAAAMAVPLVENTIWRQQLESWFAARNRPLSDSNLKQAWLPQGAIMIDNPVGTACGFRVKLNRAWLFFTPGVPSEFKTMVEQQFIPFLQQQHPLKQSVHVTKLLTLGMGESSMAQTLENLSWPAGITLGYRSYTPYLELKLIARGATESAQQEALQQASQALGDTIVADSQTTLAGEVHRLLTLNKQTLSLAESLTGGEVASQLVAIAGSSAYLKQGIVSYCNEAKQQLLNVSLDTIAQYNVVSMQTVAEMARGSASLLATDFAIATSGIAGPEGGTEALPVGSVAIAVKTPRAIYSQLLALPKRSRQYIRELTVAVALDMLRRAILEQPAVADYGYIQRTNKAEFALVE